MVCLFFQLYTVLSVYTGIKNNIQIAENTIQFWVVKLKIYKNRVKGHRPAYGNVILVGLYLAKCKTVDGVDDKIFLIVEITEALLYITTAIFLTKHWCQFVDRETT